MNEAKRAGRPAEATATPSGEGRVGLMSTGTALVAAIFSSACCWLPLALIGVGASAGGAATFFETYRVYFLVGAAGLLGVGFYFIYFRKPACGPGESCSVPNPKIQRLNRATLWIATVFILLFATFPEYVTTLIETPEGQPTASAATARSADDAPVIQRDYTVEGMTCEGCTSHAEKAIAALSGVREVDVSYPTKTAKVVMTKELPLGHLAAALSEFGYRITAVDGVPVPAEN